ncbi:MAG: bifunctional UDP-N-acetylglucosamine diphosphorylase/glucosamine-1-phosphate N-acetyltransferase GlmU [Eubacteriaceae bacterium]|jgi:bifunctional UDP-N-acetylglucosamine pyrophosphorylase/glucosamine-1-phosphate N-acetyltransferase|nr:bifunctional UDP-N-acetylglucosamine diphosphorylase/glucosamine-1-phosphate N-acetyltransferase GlmU [Eubacteriaceae bacterium]
MEKTKTIILAAGQGTRMRSQRPKVLHPIAGKPMILHVLDNSKKAGSDETIVVIGYKGELVQAILPPSTKTVLQTEQLGTGHAVMCALPHLERNDDMVLILMGDAPLIRPEVLSKMVQHHQEQGNGVTVLTAEIENPKGYGRMVTTTEGDLLKIVEEKDATEKEKAIAEVNGGMYCFTSKYLVEALSKIVPQNAQGEYYLTDTIEIIRSLGQRVGVFKTDAYDITAVNSKKQLAEVEKAFRQFNNCRLMDQGAIMIDPDTTYLSADTTIGRDTVIYPGVLTEGVVSIGEDCVIGQNSRIVDSSIGDRTQVDASTILESVVAEDTTVGPYAYIRPGSKIGKNVKIGDFVEVKNAVIKDGAKASHLTYIGDAEVGENVNLGCGTVFVNYDGFDKNKVVVGKNTFIGCNTNLIAPVEVGENVYVAAGSTITENIPSRAFAIARQKQVVKENYQIRNKKKGEN